MKNRYKDCTLEVPKGYEVPGSRIRGEPVRIIGVINIDYSCFKKTPEERFRLKMAKRKLK
jgi:hypothetical protein